MKKPLFTDSYATIITDKNGNLLGGYIADDEQWRFPPLLKIPDKVKKCTILYEDRKFYWHPGIDPLAIIRAIKQNFSGKKVISGASTIPMQVMRLYRNNKKRQLLEKMIEAVLAVRLSVQYSKEDILKLYVSHAPYGGNIVGIGAASWRYFGREPRDLTWAESALLAVLPNNPALIHPGKNNEILQKKRNFILHLLHQKKIITLEEYELSLLESLPSKPYSIPQEAYHLLMRSIKEKHKGEKINTTLDYVLQNKANNIIAKHHKLLKYSMINNIALIALKVDSGEVLAYVGNTVGDNHSNNIDMIMNERSPGSLLKPILYACQLEEGMMPDELVRDVPIIYEGFAPKNFGKTFDGRVPASQALIRSLNVPFIYMLKDYGYQKFYRKLEQMGINFRYNASHYALTLILGGAEVKLWEITSIYAGMARVLKNYQKEHYSDDFYFANHYISPAEDDEVNKIKVYKKTGLFNASSIWFAFNAMKEVARPGTDSNWELFNSAFPIAWKTGTSYGNRDAWSIGITPEYVVGVWVGNADYEGRPEIKGINVAAPILFDFFQNLSSTKWFDKPLSELKYEKICKESGMAVSMNCEHILEKLVPMNHITRIPCQFHKILHLDETEKFQVDSSFYPIAKMVHKKWFILPPVDEWYYKKKYSQYKIEPPAKTVREEAMGFIYPQKSARIYVPVELDGTYGKTVFEIAHRKPEKIIFWHLDGEYLGKTKNIHQIALYPPPGKHEISAIDEDGNLITEVFEIMPKKQNNIYQNNF